MPIIALENVTKTYQRRGSTVEALKELSLSIEVGEFVAVQGPSGCGKSTMLSIVGGLIAPTAGRVVVAGQDLAALSAAERTRFRAEQIGFVFQMFHLLPYLTVLDNVALAAEGDNARQRAEAILARFDLTDRLTHHPAELSAGQAQRAAIARALINHPKLLLADEPTGNLDGENATVVLALLADYHRGGGTIVLVTHQAEAAGQAQRVVHLRQGRLATS